METQVQKLKLNVTNIKSYLMKSNKTLSKLKKQKKNLTLNIIKKNQQQKKETKLETKRLGIGSGFLSIAGAVSRPAMGIFDKIMEFFGLIALGFLIKSLPTIINKINEFLDSDFFKGFTGFITGLTAIVKGMIDITISLSTSVRNNFVKGYNKAAKELDNFVNWVSKGMSIFDSLLNGNQQQNSSPSSSSSPARTQRYGRTYTSPTGGQFFVETDKDGNPIGPLPKSWGQRIPDPRKNSTGWGPVQNKSSGGTVQGRNTQRGESGGTQPAFTFRRTGVGKKAQRDADTGFSSFSQSVDGINDTVNKESENVEAFTKMLTNWTQLNSTDSSGGTGGPYNSGRTGAFASGAWIGPPGDNDRQQTGLNMNLPGGIGTPIYAPRDLIYRTTGTDGKPAVGLQGTATALGPNGRGFGFYGAYRYKEGGKEYEVLMGHFRDMPYRGTKDGDIIPKGTLLGYQGASGRSVSNTNGVYPHISLHINGIGFRASNAELVDFAYVLKDARPRNPRRPGGGGGGNGGLRSLNKSSENQSVFIYAVQPVQSYIPFPVPMPVSVPSSNSGGRGKTPSIWRG